MDVLLELFKTYGAQLSVFGAAIAFILLYTNFKQKEKLAVFGKNLKHSINS